MSNLLTPFFVNLSGINMKTKGIVKWFNVAKGYGFLVCDGHNDIFVHYTAITDDGYKELVEGEGVTFDLIQGPIGNQAANVERIA